MDTLTSHPTTAQQAHAFTSASSLSFPGGMTPPSEKDGNNQAIAGQVNGGNAQLQKGAPAMNGNGVIPTTPAATPAAAGQGSGIVPTLQ